MNHWFIRNLAPGARQWCHTKYPKTFPHTIVAPADARVMAWQTSMPATRYWIKNTAVDVGSLIGSSPPSSVNPAVWNGGPLVSLRLAPQDYHRFHSPVNGTIVALWAEGGTLLSVNSDAAPSKNKVFLNSRKVIVIDSTCCGKVAYIAIGATCVGSVVLYKDSACTTLLRVGDVIGSGDQMGIMQVN